MRDCLLSSFVFSFVSAIVQVFANTTASDIKQILDLLDWITINLTLLYSRIKRWLCKIILPRLKTGDVLYPNRTAVGLGWPGQVMNYMLGLNIYLEIGFGQKNWWVTPFSSSKTFTKKVTPPWMPMTPIFYYRICSSYKNVNVCKKKQSSKSLFLTVLRQF